MSESILNSLKKVLSLDVNDSAFDADILMHINSTFSTLQQLGIGPVAGFMIEDADATWDDFLLEDMRLNMVKSYMYLSVRMIFDPPTTSYTITAFQKQKEEYEWRLNVTREGDSWAAPVVIPELSS